MSKTKTVTAQAEDALAVAERMAGEEHAGREKARLTLARLCRMAANGEAASNGELVTALEGAAESPATFAQEVRSLVRRQQSIGELIRLRGVADDQVPALKAEAEKAEAEFAPVLEAHRKRMAEIERRRVMLLDQVQRGELYRKWNEVFGRDNPPMLAIRAKLHKEEEALAKLRDAKDHFESQAASDLYSDARKAEAAQAVERHKSLIVTASEKIEGLKVQLATAERNWVTAELLIKYDKPTPAPTTAGGSKSVMPANLFGGNADAVVSAPRAPAVQKVGA